jgi:hypothetical protein
MTYLNSLLSMLKNALQELAANGGCAGNENLINQYLQLLPSVNFYPYYLGGPGFANGYTWAGPTLGPALQIGNVNVDILLNPSGTSILVPFRYLDGRSPSQLDTLLHEIWHYTGFIHVPGGNNTAQQNADLLLPCVLQTQAYKNFQNQNNDPNNRRGRQNRYRLN